MGENSGEVKGTIFQLLTFFFKKGGEIWAVDLSMGL